MMLLDRWFLSIFANSICAKIGRFVYLFLYVLFGVAADISHIARFVPALGGFAAGFSIAWLMCVKGWVSMEKYEKSLLQFWREYTNNGKD